MGCLSVNLTRIGGDVSARATGTGHVSALLGRDGGISASLPRVGRVTASASRVGGISVSMTRHEGMVAWLSQECRTNLNRPYLLIRPDVIWVVPDWAVDNEVLSNVTWIIN